MTNVTAQVKDINGTLYNSCRYSATLVNLSNSTLTLGATALPDQFKQVTGTQCDANGNLSTKLVANTALIPNNSQWRFTICDNTGANCFNTQLSITGTTQDITTQVQAAAVILPVTNTTLLSGNNNYTGTNLHSGAETFSSINNVYYTSAELDGTALNLDICGAIARGWAWAVAKGWHGVIVDARAWHGVQTCSSNMFTNYPFTAGVNALFSGTVWFSPDVSIVASVTQVLPSSATIEGFGAHPNTNPPWSVATGALLKPANTFPTNTPLIEMSADPGVGTGPSQGEFIQNFGVSCIPPNGSFIAGSIGIRNQYAQDIVGMKRVHIMGCWTGLDLETGGINGGSQNSGEYDEIHISMEGVTDPTASCIRVGTAGTFQGPIKAIRTVSCVNTSGVHLAVGIRIEGNGVNVEAPDVESFDTGIQVGMTGAAITFGSLKDALCVPSIFTPVTCLEMGSSINGYNVTNLHAFGAITNLLVDHGLHGGTIPLATESQLGTYVRSGGGGTANNTQQQHLLLSTSSVIPSFLPGPSEVINTTSYTATRDDNGKTFPTSCAANCTFTLPATAPFQSWTVRVINYGAGAVTIDPNGVALNGSTAKLVLPGGTSSGITINTGGSTYHYQGGFAPLGVSTVCRQNGGSTVTGNGAAQVVASCTLSQIPPGGCVEAYAHLATTFTAVAKVLSWQLGTTSNYGSTSATSANADTTFYFCNNPGSQIANQSTLGPLVQGAAVNTGGSLTTAVDTTGSVTLNLLFNGPNTESVAPKAFLVKAY